MIRDDRGLPGSRPWRDKWWPAAQAHFMPSNWATVDEVHALTMRCWVSPYHERIDGLLGPVPAYRGDATEYQAPPSPAYEASRVEYRRQLAQIKAERAARRERLNTARQERKARLVEATSPSPPLARHGMAQLWAVREACDRARGLL